MSRDYIFESTINNLKKYSALSSIYKSDSEISKSLKQFSDNLNKQLTPASAALQSMASLCSNNLAYSMEPLMKSSRIIDKSVFAAFSASSVFKMTQQQTCLSLSMASKVLKPYNIEMNGVAVVIQKLQKTLKHVHTNTIHDSESISDALVDVDIVDEYAYVPEVIAENMSELLNLTEDDFENMIPLNKCRKISLELFYKYFCIFVQLASFAMLFYPPIHDHFADKETEKYQHEMLNEEKKQTQILKEINEKIPQAESTSTTKEK